MRYFFITYTAANAPYGTTVGNLWFNLDRFPSNDWIKEKVFEHNRDQGVSLNGITITFLFEFRSEEDYNAFAQ